MTSIFGNNNANTLNGTSGDDDIHAYGGNDTINIQQGGIDTVYADAGDDTINAGAALTAADHISGGSGYDILNISGNYSAGLDFTATGLTGIEKIVLGSGHSYVLDFDNANVAAGATLTVDGSALGSANTMYLYFANETDGNLVFYGGAGNDSIYAGSHTNILHLETGGEDLVQGDSINQGGTYQFYMGGAFDAGDTLEPEYGSGTLYLNGDYTGAHAVFLNASTIQDMPTVNFAAGHSYKLVLNYNNVFHYSQTVDASSLGASDSVYYDASACYSAYAFFFKGGAGNDTFMAGSPNANYYYLQPGGNDTVKAGYGGDTIYMGASLNSADAINGGDGNDVVDLNGDYSSQVVFNAGTMVNVETMVLEGTHNYNLKFADATVAAGQTLTVNGLTLGSGVLTLDASAETTGGNYNVVGGAASDSITTGNGNDNIDLEMGGNDILHAGAGTDTIKLNTAFTAADQIDGGAGTVDGITLNGDYSGLHAVTMNASTLTNVEQITMAAGFNYSLTTNDATVAAGQSLFVDSSALTAANALTFDGSAETDGSFAFAAGAGNDVLTGGAGNDTFYLSKGGNDTVKGGGGKDSFTFTTAFTAADQVDGGTGADTVSLNGDYIFASALTLGATTLQNIETLTLASGHSYTITVNDATLAAGQSMTVNAATLGIANILTFNASAETNSDAGYVINAGAADDTLTGGAGNDVFGLTFGGSDTAFGGGGDDTFNFGGALTSSDTIDGGSGNDVVTLNGHYSAGLTFGATTMVNVETLKVNAGHIYNLTSNDATVAAGQTLTVNASTLTAGDRLTFNGAAETDGHFKFMSGGGGDNFTGGALSDKFVYTSADQSTGTHYDTITGFDFGLDRFNIPGGTGTITGIDGAIVTGNLDSGASFDIELATATSNLNSHHAVLFTADAGTLSGQSFLVVDLDGNTGYQSGADLVIHMVGATGSLATGDFI